MAEQPLIVCPVCETRQPNAWFCAICGKALHALPKHLPVTTPMLEELELTVVDSARINVASFPIEGLEPTLRAPVPSAEPPLPELDPTSLPAQSVPADTMPGFESNRVAAAAPQSEAEPLSCLSCGIAREEGAGLFCPGCGLRYPVLQSTTEVESVSTEKVVCPVCTARDQHPGQRCGVCGRPVPPEG